jgi:hypothetical protein
VLPNTLFLGRLLIARGGLASNPAFQVSGHSVIDTSHLYYDGNSQGGIEGRMTTAVSPADGYAQHMTSNPLPDTPSHHVLLQVVYGDHQVSMYSAAVEAGTIGASFHSPALDLGTKPSPGPEPVLRHPRDRPLSVPRLGDRDLEQRSGASAAASVRERPARRLGHQPRPASGPA